MGLSRDFSEFSVFLITVICAIGNALPEKHIIEKRNIFSFNSQPGPRKNFTGLRVSPYSEQMIYYFEQTVAVVEITPERYLLNCELMEVRTKQDKVATLAALQPIIPKQVGIRFGDMNNLMQYCQEVEPPREWEEQLLKKKVREASNGNSNEPEESRLDAREFSTVFRGVYPGTKWCGAGDLADTYYDLGTLSEVDKCCRTHDLCPIKILGFRTQYNLTNYSPYTRSHCECDNIFRHCLKKIGNNYSDILGNIYFNIARPGCMKDVLSSDGRTIVERVFVKQPNPY